MNNGFFLKFVRIWWLGFKVFCRWTAFYVVLAIVFLPAAGLVALVGDNAGGILSIALAVVMILVVPIVFYLTSKYLLLLVDDDHTVAEGEENPPQAGTGSNRRMRDKIVISTVVAFCISSWLSPPDAVAALVLGFESAFLCGAALLILARSNFMKSSPRSIQALVCVLVCILSVLPIHARSLYKMAGHIDWPPDSSSVSSSSSEPGSVR